MKVTFSVDTLKGLSLVPMVGGPTVPHREEEAEVRTTAKTTEEEPIVKPNNQTLQHLTYGCPGFTGTTFCLYLPVYLNTHYMLDVLHLALNNECMFFYVCGC